MNSPKLERSLAGLQAGMFGGIALLLVMMLFSVLSRRSGWSYPNLLAACFYGVRSMGSGISWSTLSGAAFQLLIAASAGAVFGGVFGGVRGNRRMALLGMAWGTLVFYGSENYYRAQNPIVAAYIPKGAAAFAHLVYGVCLAGMGRVGGLERREAPALPVQTGAALRERAELRVPEIHSESASLAQSAQDSSGSAGRERTL